MILGKVVGTVVSTQESVLSGLTILAVVPIDLKTGALKDGGVVAVDAVGAGVGEIVLYASGSSARQTTVTNNPALTPPSWPSWTPTSLKGMSCIRRVRTISPLGWRTKRGRRKNRAHR